MREITMADTTTRIVIIGASAAGLSAAQEARKTSNMATITLLSEEPHLPYHRPSLTEYIGDASVERRPNFLLQPEEWFAAQRMDLRRATRATAIDRDKRQVALASGEMVPFDRLILAVGAQPFVPMTDALSRENVFAVRTLDDARKVAAATATSAVVIGGGLLGLETANALKKKGLSVHIIELADRVLPMQLDPEGSTFFSKILTAHGMQLRLGAQVDRFEERNGRVTGVLLRSGERVATDLVVFSIGVRANIALAQAAGLTVGRGIIVNEKMETSAPGIYACGDCAEFGRGPQLWMPAVKQGAVAGANAGGGSATFRPDEYPAMLKVFGTQLYSVGDIGRDAQAAYETPYRIDEAAGRYRKLWVREGELVGGILIGDIRRAGALSKGIQQGLALSEAEKIFEG